MDWPNWRGPQQNRVSMEKGLVEEWNPDGGEGSNLLWKKKELAGRSTPIVMGGELYVIVHDKTETADEGEKVFVPMRQLAISNGSTESMSA